MFIHTRMCGAVPIGGSLWCQRGLGGCHGLRMEGGGGGGAEGKEREGKGDTDFDRGAFYRV